MGQEAGHGSSGSFRGSGAKRVLARSGRLDWFLEHVLPVVLMALAGSVLGSLVLFLLRLVTAL